MNNNDIKNVDASIEEEIDSGVANDFALRPKMLKDFIGQQQVHKNLSTFIIAASKRNEPMDHILLYGSPGLGKTTLAHIISNELNV